MLESLHNARAFLREKRPVPPPEEHKPSALERYAITHPETAAEAADLMKEENTKSELVIDNAVHQLDAWTKKTGLDFSVERAKLEQKRQGIRFDQHLNTLDLFNLMQFGPAVEVAYKKLSGASKEMYHLFVESLPRSTTDNTQDAIIEITGQLASFKKMHGELATDLEKFFNKYYQPLRESSERLLAKRKKEAEEQAANKATMPKMDPRQLRDFLSTI